MTSSAVAIIGAGPAGLACARWLKREGFAPVLFEQSARIGGQWSGDPMCSGVWPSLCTNTGRFMTEFSDLAHTSDAPLYPDNRVMCEYLLRYADKFDLVERVRLRTRVERIEAAPDGAWAVRAICDGETREEHFERVVVASGRFNRPVAPEIPGLSTFSGRGGIIHAFHCKAPSAYRGQRVLVGGCAVSALELACELVMQGAAKVVSANRRQRYVLPKNVAGVPIEHLIHTRFSALARETLPLSEVVDELKAFIVRSCGTPDRYGAPKPDEDVLVAGITQCQFFLPLVSEGRISVKPWLAKVEADTVHFSDGTSEPFDALVFGTGFRLHLPFLSHAIRQALGLDQNRMELYDFTFHPRLPGLAFAGLFQVAGPYLPPIELQARWIAYVWGGVRESTPGSVLQPGREWPQHSPEGVHHMPSLTLAFARNAGVEPRLEDWPELAEPLLLGPLLPASFRLSGRDSTLDAAARIRMAAPAAAAERIDSPERRALLCKVAQRRRHLTPGADGTDRGENVGLWRVLAGLGE